MDAAELESALEYHDFSVQKHGTVHAEKVLRQRSPETADRIIREYAAALGEVREPPRGLLDQDHQDWYLPKPLHQSPRWDYARGQIDLPEPVIEQTDAIADQILASFDSPYEAEIATRGLVLGHVQSGKTTSFLSVAAKAADNGFHLIIILAGVHNSLRRQTQDRAARTLVHQRELWWLGTELGDFRPDGNPLESHLSGHGKRGLLVVKKNSTVLAKLADWLERTSDSFLRRHAVLVIDDEADQAGLDVGKGDDLEGVHKQLHRIVNLRTSNDERRCAYLAYTATPYANILTSQDEYGLYPRDFIYPLPLPDKYTGPAQLFGDARVGEPIRLEEAPGDADDDLLTESLQEAIRWFVLATAARAALGKPLETFHSSMLIHTSQRVAEQEAYKPVVERFLTGLLAAVDHDPDHLQDQYLDQLARVPSQVGGGRGKLDEATARWGAVRRHVPKVLRRLVDETPAAEPFEEDGHIQIARSGVIVDNGRVPWEDRLTYSDVDAGQDSVTVIAIGGNTLSRGLTLEGLVCSYFVRTARNYDTLMQMGRWFGYRPGYRHLVRIWTTPELHEWFRELTEVENELRHELEWMQEQDLQPAAYGPRIRVSPHLNITRAAAMKSVSHVVSYADQRIDPAWLLLDEESLSRNQAAARQLAADTGVDEDPDVPRLFRGVTTERIRRFLTKFRFHPNEKRVDSSSLLTHLDEHAERLGPWNVWFKSLGRTSSDRFDHGGVVGAVNPVVRAREDSTPAAYIGSIVDSKDHRVDRAGVELEAGVHYRNPDEPPLLVIYAVDPTSPPMSGSNRVPLNAPTHPISIAIALPGTETAVEYVKPIVVSSSRPVDAVENP